jgi:hypothetical protein
MAWRIDHDEQALFDLPDELVAIFPLTESGIGVNDTVRIEECACGVRKVEPALPEAGIALGCVPFGPRPLGRA